MKVTITDSRYPGEYDIHRDSNYGELGANEGQVKKRIRTMRKDGPVEVIDNTVGGVFRELVGKLKKHKANN